MNAKTSLQKLARPDLLNVVAYKPSVSKSESVLRLNSNENPWPPVTATDPLIHRYPDKQPVELVDRVASLFQVQPEHVLVTRGADDGIDALIRSFCQPGKDSVVQCSPAFVMYAFFARLQALKVIDVPLLAADGFRVDFDNLRSQTDAKMFFLCNPNNPTGSLVSEQHVLQFARFVAQQAVVVVDEAYVEFAAVESLANAATRLPNLVVLRTLSKAWSLAGARLGVVIANPQLIRYLAATTSPYPLSRSAVAAAIDCLGQDNLDQARLRIRQLTEQRDQLQTSLTQFDFVKNVFPGQANFLLVRVDDAGSLVEFLADREILVRDQSQQPGLSGCVRISIGSAEQMQQLVNSLSQYQEDCHGAGS